MLRALRRAHGVVRRFDRPAERLRAASRSARGAIPPTPPPRSSARRSPPGSADRRAPGRTAHRRAPSIRPASHTPPAASAVPPTSPTKAPMTPTTRPCRAISDRCDRADAPMSRSSAMRRVRPATTVAKVFAVTIDATYTATPRSSAVRTLLTKPSAAAGPDVRIGAQHRGDVAGRRDEQHAERRRDRRDEDARAHPALAQPRQRGGCRPRAGRAAARASMVAAVMPAPRATTAAARPRARTRACTPRSSSALWRGLSATILPSPRKITRSAWLAAIGSCVTIAMDWPWSRLAAARRPSTSRPLRESRLPVGSSAKTRSGAVASARAIATRCC